ncbi:MAG: C25 family cysteine peptidase [bacterium]
MIALLGVAGLLPRTVAATERVLESDEHHVVVEIVPGPATSSTVAGEGRQYVRLRVGDLGTTDDEGCPEIPIGGLRIALPPGTVPRLRVLSEEWSGSRPGAIVPVPHRVGIREPFGPDHVVEQPPHEGKAYLAVASYPASPFRLSKTMGLRDLRVVELSYAAARADVFLRAHRLLKRAVLEVDFEASPLRDVTRSTRPAIRAALWDRTTRSTVINAKPAQTWARAGAGDGVSVGDAPYGSGDQWKVEIDQTGLYELSFATLSAAGFPAGIPVGQVSVYQREFDLANVDDVATPAASLFKVDSVRVLLRDRNSNGVFDAGDGVIFWGRSFRDQWMTSGWESEDRYDTRNYVWVRVDGAGGARMPSRPGVVPTGVDSLTSTPSMVHREEDQRYTPYPGDFGPGRDGFESEFYYWNNQTTPTGDDASSPWHLKTGALSYDPFQVDDLVPGAAASLRTRVCPMGLQVYGNCANRLVLYIDGAQVGERQFDTIRLYGGTSTVRPDSVLTTYPIPAGRLVEGENRLTADGYSYQNNGLWSTNTRFLFDWYEVTYPRRLVARGDELLLTTANGGADLLRIRVAGFGGSNLLLVDLTNPAQPVQVALDPAQIVSMGGGTYDLRFEHDNSAGVGTYVAARETAAAPIASSAVTRVRQPSLLAGGIGAKYVVLANDELLAGAQDLASYRSARYTARATALSEVWDLFHNGTRDPVAIKCYTAYAYHRWSDPIVFLTLVGDASEDARGIGSLADRDLLPSHSLWEDYDGAPTESDQYFAEVTHDDTGAFDDLSDFFVGRLSVNTPDELSWNVDRIRIYETEKPDDAWRRRVLLYADDALSGDLGAGFSVGYGWMGNSGELGFCQDSQRNADSLRANPVDRIEPVVICQSQWTHPCPDSCNAPVGDSFPVNCETNGVDCGIWYRCRTRPSNWGPDYQCVRDALLSLALPALRNKLNDGALIWNFEGHANKYFLTHEVIWRDDTLERHDVQTLTNVDRPFIFLGFACHLAEFARDDELAAEDCLSEKMMNVRTPEQNRPAGSIGAFASSGFEFLTPNTQLNDFVLDSFFRPERALVGSPLPDDGVPGAYVWTLGESTTRARLEYQAVQPFDGQFRQAAQRFILLGDPALSPDLGSPTLTAKVNGADVEDVTDPYFASAREFPGEITVQVTASDGRGIVSTRIVDTERGEIPATDYTTHVDRQTTDGVNQIVTLTRSFTLRANESYDVRFEAVDGTGKTSSFVLRTDTTFRFLDRPVAFPNPFSSGTSVAFKTTGAIDHATLGVFTVTGRKIREIRDQGLGANFQHRLEWDGRDDRGLPVANGTYLLHVLLSTNAGSLTDNLPVVRIQ